MKPNNGANLQYSAKDSYREEAMASSYELDRYSGLLGAYRYRREQNAVGQLVDMLPPGVVIADCPCGNGRWWSVLSRRASHIMAFDISEGMRSFSSKRAQSFPTPVQVREGDAEHLPLDDEEVDYVFSHALTKHLPVPIQYNVLAEFSRVSKSGVICSFGIFSHLSYEVWRRRSLIESYPVFPEELQWMAKSAGLRIRTMRQCTTPIGVEHTVLFEKAAR